MEVITSDSKEFLKTFKEYEFDIVFADPPYALGSEIKIRKDGKVDYSKASDFMNKWDMPTGEYWEKWFIEAYRTLKHGGWLIMYGMDRQTLLFKYYGLLAGFIEQQSLYWYYISNFPKATDLSKAIDKNAGVEREVGAFKYKCGKTPGGERIKQLKGGAECYESIASTDLEKKYDGYKYSISPLKQTCETIMVFKKPTKTGSVLHDTLAMENGDETITCSALDIDGNRVGTNESDKYDLENRGVSRQLRENEHTMMKTFTNETKHGVIEAGRYPSQTYVDEEVSKALDRQSGISDGGTLIHNQSVIRTGMKEDAPAFNSKNSGIDVNKGQGLSNYGDTGGCSKILHKVKYDDNEHDIFIYEPKVDTGERNKGCDNLDEKLSASSEFRPNHLEKALKGEDGNPYGRWTPLKNNHPTVKPIDLNAKILKLFKTPNEQRICYPFAGSGSEIIGGLQTNFQNWVACEINQEYVDIANARIKHFQENEHIQLNLFEMDNK